MVALLTNALWWCVDTEELSRKWREELDEGFSPMNVWANPRAAQAEARAKKEGGKVGRGGGWWEEEEGMALHSFNMATCHGCD